MTCRGGRNCPPEPLVPAAATVLACFLRSGVRSSLSPLPFVPLPFALALALAGMLGSLTCEEGAPARSGARMGSWADMRASCSSSASSSAISSGAVGALNSQIHQYLR